MKSVKVPNVIGDDTLTAIRKIKKTKLRPAVEKLVVNNQSPKAGKPVQIGSVITLTMEVGVEVPDVIGLRPRDARRIILEADLIPKFVGSSQGSIVSQEPEGGKFVARRSVVKVFLKRRDP